MERRASLAVTVARGQRVQSARNPCLENDTQDDIELPAQAPGPESTAPDFNVDDEVAVLDDDGHLELDARVTGVELPTAYKITIGSGRSRRATRSFPRSRVFPQPWASAARAKVGDTIYERRFGNFEPRRCVVTAVPGDVRQSVTARCDSSERTQSIARRDVFYAFEPATVSNVSPGQYVYFEKTRWAMVVGKSDTRIAIRVAGFAVKDKLVVPSKVQRVR